VALGSTYEAVESVPRQFAPLGAKFW
jgi:hypothetical protein